MTNLDELKNPQKIQYEKKNYVCEFCNYNTFSKKDYNKHLLTDKHKKLQNTSSDEQKNPKNPIVNEPGYENLTIENSLEARKYIKLIEFHNH